MLCEIPPPPPPRSANHSCQYICFLALSQPYKNFVPCSTVMVAPLIMDTLVEGPMPCQANIAAPSNVPNWPRQFAPYRDYPIHRIPKCLSLRPNGLPPPALPHASVSPPGTKGGKGVGGGQDSLADEGAGGSQFGRLERKPGTLSTKV